MSNSNNIDLIIFLRDTPCMAAPLKTKKKDICTHLTTLTYNFNLER